MHVLILMFKYMLGRTNSQNLYSHISYINSPSLICLCWKKINLIFVILVLQVLDYSVLSAKLLVISGSRNVPLWQQKCQGVGNITGITT